MSRNKYKQFSDKNLPAIPDKRYFTISEVSQLCLVKAYVLRYWEQVFPQLKPIKRRRRRYYQQQDVLLIRQIKKLLYEHGFTIEGARGQLAAPPEVVNHTLTSHATIEKIIVDLELVLAHLKNNLPAAGNG